MSELNHAWIPAVLLGERKSTDKNPTYTRVFPEISKVDTMNALVLTKPGSLDHLEMQEIEKPEPMQGELQVRVEAVGLNPVDYKLANGRGVPSWKYPHVLGLDVAGTVSAIGAGVEGFNPGDRVVYHGNLSKPVGFAEFAVNAAHAVARIPEGVSFEDAAAIPCAGYSAFLALHQRLQIREGMTVMIQAGAGGVGGFGIQIARMEGCTVITTASQHHHEYVRELGAHHAIDYRNESVPDRVKEITGGKGVDAVLDTVGLNTANEAFEYMKFGAGIACLVRMPDTMKIRPFSLGPSIHEITLGGAYLAGDRDAQDYMAYMGQYMMNWLKDGKIQSMVSETIGLKDIPDALRRLEGRHVRGKIIANISHETE